MENNWDIIIHISESIVGRHLKLHHNIEMNRQRTIAVTEWAHCQRQVAFFKCYINASLFLA